MRSNFEASMARGNKMIKRIMNYIKIEYLFLGIRDQKIAIKNIRRWKRSFYHYLCELKETSYDYPDRFHVIEGFAKSNIQCISKARERKKQKEPILICVIYNEIERMQTFLEHYRNIGIKRFAVIDNGSTDGTVRYLMKQGDVDLFQVKDKFESRIKAGWINRVIAYYGTRCWYLVVDADELFVWQGKEESSIQDCLSYLKKQNITRARSLMVDMYPKESAWSQKDSFEEVFPRCRYFDCDTYYHKNIEDIYLLCGGPRNRVFGMEVWLTKYPLFRLRENEIMSNAHTIFPYENTKTPCFFAILHYKFMTKTDLVKMKKYARTGNFAGGSFEYKTYVKKHRANQDSFHFYYPGSEEYISSQSLSKIKEIDQLPLLPK